MKAVIILLKAPPPNQLPFLSAPRMMSAPCPLGNRTEQSPFPRLVSTPQSQRVRAATHGWGQLLGPLAARERSRDVHSPKSQVIFHFTHQ